MNDTEKIQILQWLLTDEFGAKIKAKITLDELESKFVSVAGADVCYYCIHQKNCKWANDKCIKANNYKQFRFQYNKFAPKYAEAKQAEKVDVLDLFLDENNELKYNSTCTECKYPCKQSYRVKLVHCPYYKKVEGNDEAK